MTKEWAFCARDGRMKKDGHNTGCLQKVTLKYVFDCLKYSYSSFKNQNLHLNMLYLAHMVQTIFEVKS